ncbi:MAG TPA: GvpL/GvpF family gas vesicle protein, partial [Gaiellaceae bacterium]
RETSPGPTAGLVVYGVVRPSIALGSAPSGLHGARVELVAAGEVAALVSKLPPGELRARRSDLLSHSRVLEHALATSPVLPLRFGIVFEDAAAVTKKLLVGRRDELNSLLARFENLVELRVKAFHVEDEVLRDVVLGDRTIARLSEATRILPEGLPHPDRLRLGEAVAHAVEAERVADADAILDWLRPLAEDVAVEPETPPGFVLSASFLVRRHEVAPFDTAMDELARRHERRIRFKYLGPLPPHSFVSFDSSP